MNQRQVILAVGVVGLGALGFWAWHVASQSDDETPAQAAAPIPASPFGPSGHIDASEPAPLAADAFAPRIEAAPVAPEVDQSESAPPPAQVALPNVDTPEPAETRFARGAHSEPSPN